MTAPDRYTCRFDDGALTLCRGCLSVLVLEGQLGGDPTQEKVLAGDMLGATPCLVDRECDNCEAIRRFEEKRALLPDATLTAPVRESINQGGVMYPPESKSEWKDKEHADELTALKADNAALLKTLRDLIDGRRDAWDMARDGIEKPHPGAALLEEVKALRDRVNTAAVSLEQADGALPRLSAGSLPPQFHDALDMTRARIRSALSVLKAK